MKNISSPKIDKERRRSPWLCRRCQTQIGVIRRHTRKTPPGVLKNNPTRPTYYVHRLHRPDGSWLEGKGGVPCPSCGKVRVWLPGKVEMERVTGRVEV